MGTHLQNQSPLVSKLPRDIRALIYHELWRSYGLRQHIQEHWISRDAASGSHLCHWPCTTPFTVRDPVQDDLEAKARDTNLTLGQGFKDRPSCRAMQSPWLNHWPCGERAMDRYGARPLRCITTAATVCWKDGTSAGVGRAPYLPMLLSCKIISDECLSSIYRETTFVFTDPETVQAVAGYCVPRVSKREQIPPSRLPSGLLRFATTIEVSLPANFALLVPCTNSTTQNDGTVHDVYDFHWLGLQKFDCLCSLRLFIAARGLALRFDAEEHGEVYMTQLDGNALKSSLARLDGIRSVTISAPLSPPIGDEEGFVQLGVRAHLWKRGCGDRFHPLLDPTELAALSGADERIYSFKTGEVRVAKGLKAMGVTIPPN